MDHSLLCPFRRRMNAARSGSRDGGSVARTLAAIDVNGLARHEARRFQIEDGAYDVRDLTHPAKRVQLGELRMCFDGMHWRLDDAGRNRIHSDGELRDVKEARKVDAQHSRVISFGILSERLGDEYASVVYEGIDAPEPGQALGNRTLGRLPVGNVAGHHQDLIIVGRPDRPCRRDHPVIAMAICFDKGCAHALRGASDDGNLPVAAHARLLHPSRSRIFRCRGGEGGPSIRMQEMAKMAFSYPL